MPFGSSFNLGVTYHALLGCILQRLDHFQPLFKTHLFNVICLQVAKFLQERKQTRSTSSPKERTTPVQLHVLYQVYYPLRDDLKPPKAFYQQQEDEKKLELYSLFTPVLQEKSFGIHEKSNIRGF